jgi:nitrate reductase gamma subunit
MAVRLSAQRTRRALLPRNIVIFMFLVLISVRGRVNTRASAAGRMMVYNTQSYWVSGLCLLSEILNTRKHNVSETGSVFPSSGDGKGDTVLGLLERTNLNH